MNDLPVLVDTILPFGQSWYGCMDLLKGMHVSCRRFSAMAMVALLLDKKTARHGQLTMQYAPNPPFNDGDPSVADPSILFDVTNSMREGVVKTVAGFQAYIQKWGDKITS